MTNMKGEKGDRRSWRRTYHDDYEAGLILDQLGDFREQILNQFARFREPLAEQTMRVDLH